MIRSDKGIEKLKKKENKVQEAASKQRSSMKRRFQTSNYHSQAYTEDQEIPISTFKDEKILENAILKK